MNQQSNENRNMFDDFEQSMNIVMFLIHTWACSLEVFLHKNMGTRYLGFTAVAVFGLIPIFAVFWEGHNLEPLMGYLAFYFLMVIVTRATAVTRRLRGEICHSYYNGFPRLLNPKSRIDELQFKMFQEPLLVFIFALLVIQINQPLGWYLIFGAASLRFKSFVWSRVDDVKVMDLNDAMIEQSHLEERFRHRGRR